jgi:hypothetical protein
LGVFVHFFVRFVPWVTYPSNGVYEQFFNRSPAREIDVFLRGIMFYMLVLAPIVAAGVAAPALPFLASPYLSILVVAAIGWAISNLVDIAACRNTLSSKWFHAVASMKMFFQLSPFVWFGLSAGLPAAAMTVPPALTFMVPLTGFFGPELLVSLVAPLLVAVVVGLAAGLIEWARDKWQQRQQKRKSGQILATGGDSELLGDASSTAVCVTRKPPIRRQETNELRRQLLGECDASNDSQSGGLKSNPNHG